MDARARACPLAYRYQPAALAQPPLLEAGNLYAVLAQHAIKGNVEEEIILAHLGLADRGWPCPRSPRTCWPWPT
jgi:hypothetical protein